MDGSVEARIPLFDQEQPFVPREAGTKHESAQTAEKRVAVGNASRVVNLLGKIFYENGVRHSLIQNGAASQKPPHQS